MYPSFYKPEQIGDPLYQPNQTKILQEALRAGLPKANRDSSKVLRLHVDEMPDFSWLLTVVKDGKIVRLAPEALKNMLEIPSHMQEGLEWYVDPKLHEYDSVLGGRLSVPNAWAGTKRSVEWDYASAARITQHAYTIDWHGLTHVFNAHMYVAMKTEQAKSLNITPGSIPRPFVHGSDELFPVMTPDRIYHKEHNPDGIWKPLFDPNWVWKYVTTLVEKNLMPLIIWPIHCQRQTLGACIDPVVLAGQMYHNYARGFLTSEPLLFYKGTNWRVDEYGVWGAEVEDPKDPNSGLRVDTLRAWDQYDLIVMSGFALDKCVLRSAQQQVDIFEGLGMPEMNKKTVFLKDCSATIPGFEEMAEKAWAELAQKGLRVETTKTFSLV